MLTATMTASAMSYEQARNDALFLTDKMTYELNLTDEQYEAAYEINLDYLMGVAGRHLIGEEQGFVASLLVAHCTSCHCRGQHHHQCEKHLLHNRIVLNVKLRFTFSTFGIPSKLVLLSLSKTFDILFYYSHCKGTTFLHHIQRIFPKQVEENPYK